VKSPKLFVLDSGLACHLLGIDTAAELLITTASPASRSPDVGDLGAMGRRRAR
jgi:hypothetical protein